MIPNEAGIPMLHVYSPYAHHCDAYIVGNRLGLERLRRSLGNLLDRLPHEPAPDAEETTAIGLFVSDGEGFTLVLHLINTDDGMDHYAVPYTADYAGEEDNDAGGNPDWPKRPIQDNT